ncbi:MAG: Gfo/Idh/MocA family protein [Myxococcota bacterium]
MTRELGAVVVGTGFGVLTHLRALRAAGFEVRALVGRQPERTRQRARDAGVPHGLTSLAEAMALPGVDAVTIATPPHTHAELVLEAVRAGRHVVCEKPFARDADEARTMLDAARAAGVVHRLGTEFRWATGQALATRAVHDGVIGEPRVATFLFQAPALADPSGEVPAWWGRAEEGGGWLGAYASHVIDHMRSMLGEFEGVSASLSRVSDRDWSAEDTYTVHFRTRSGAEGVLQSSAGAWGPPVFCSRVVGSRGTLWIEGDAVRVADAAGARTLDLPDDLRLPPPVPPDASLLVTAYDMLHSMGIDLAPYTRLFECFAAGILGEPVPPDPAPATFEDGLAGQQVLDAIRRSSREHVWVALPR